MDLIADLADFNMISRFYYQMTFIITIYQLRNHIKIREIRDYMLRLYWPPTS